MSYSSVLSISFHPIENDDDGDRKRTTSKRRITIYITGCLSICVVLLVIGLILIMKSKRTHQQQQHNHSTTKESMLFNDEPSLSTMKSNITGKNSSICQLPLYPSYNKLGRTVAGITDRSGNDLYHLNMPTCVYLNSEEEIYICDGLNKRIVKYPSSNSSRTRVLIAGSMVVPVNNSRLIYIDHRNDHLYFLDYDINQNYRVQCVVADSTGYQTSVILTGHWSMYIGMHVDRYLNIFVAESSNYRVIKWLSPDYQQYIVVAGNGTAGLESNQLSNPRGVYVDPVNNDLYITDGQRIQWWPNGSDRGHTIVAHGLSNPTVIQRDCHGNLYVLDGDIVKFFSLSSNVLGLEGVIVVGVPYSYQTRHCPQSIDCFYYPNDMYLNVENGDLYIADTGRHRIQKFTIDGELNPSR